MTLFEIQIKFPYIIDVGSYSNNDFYTPLDQVPLSVNIKCKIASKFKLYCQPLRNSHSQFKIRLIFLNPYRVKLLFYQNRIPMKRMKRLTATSALVVILLFFNHFVFLMRRFIRTFRWKTRRTQGADDRHDVVDRRRWHGSRTCDLYPHVLIHE